MSEDIEIRKGVRQGCVLSPTLFNLYSEAIFSKALQNSTEGIKINGEPINNLRYADDTVIIASELADLQNLLQKIYLTSEEYGLALNVSKTKWMLMSRNGTAGVGNLTLNRSVVERVERHTYLGTMVHDRGEMTTEIRSRVEKARANFLKMR